MAFLVAFLLALSASNIWAGEKDFYRNLTVAKLNEEIEAGNQFVKEINEVEADMTVLVPIVAEPASQPKYPVTRPPRPHYPTPPNLPPVDELPGFPPRPETGTNKPPLPIEPRLLPETEKPGYPTPRPPRPHLPTPPPNLPEDGLPGFPPQPHLPTPPPNLPEDKLPGFPPRPHLPTPPPKPTRIGYKLPGSTPRPEL